MAGPPTAAFTQVTAVYTGLAVPDGAMTTLGLTGYVGGPWDAGDVAAVLEDGLTSLITTDLQIVEFRFKRGPEATGPTFVQPSGAVGNISGYPNQPQVCTLVRKQVDGVSGRFGGRMYAPATPTAWTAKNGVVTPAASTVTALNTMYADLVSVGAQPVVFSTLGSDPRQVTGFAIQGKVATQRRRIR